DEARGEAEKKHRQHQPRLRSKPPIEHQADQEPAGRSADEMAQYELPGLVARIGLALRSPLRLRLLQAIEPLIERFEPCVWWKLRNLVGFVLCHASPLCVAPAESHRVRQGRGTWRKATPPRRGPFMNRGVDSQPRDRPVSCAPMKR